MIRLAAKWIEALRDERARGRILVRIDRVQMSNLGDVKSVGEGLSEMRIDYGPGYRVYFKRKGRTAVVLLVGGDRDSQEADIRLARKLASEI